MALGLDGGHHLPGAQGRHLGPHVPRDVGAQVGDDGRRRVVGDDGAAGAQEGREEGREGRARAELQGGEAGDVEVARRGAEGPLLLRALAAAGLQAQAQGVGLDELGQEEGRVPQVVAKEAAVLVAVRGR